LRYQFQGNIHLFENFDYKEAKELLHILTSSLDNMVLVHKDSETKNFIGGSIDNVLEYLKNPPQCNNEKENEHARH
jgi:hypothetical protein